MYNSQILLHNLSLPFTSEDGDFFALAEKKLKSVISRSDIVAEKIYKKSVDARKSDDIRFVCSVLLQCRTEEKKINLQSLTRAGGVLYKEETLEIPHGEEKSDFPVVVVGFGPCGMFASMLLAENGYKVIVLERGGDVSQRKLAFDRFNNEGILDENCNIQFGAGGAGTFSDGKLITRINDSRCRFVTQRLVDLGADEDILTQARPHIGTDRLCDIVENASSYVISHGGEIRYNCRLTGINYKCGKAVSVVTEQGDIPCSAVVLAIGHSSRDTYYSLMEQGYDITPKPFSVGVRIEHLKEDIDKAMYGKHAGDKRLGGAEYNLSKRVGDVGVYSFCMCPGGEVVAAASEHGGVVTNGMSCHDRNGRNSNSAIAVSVSPENPIEFQRMLERKAYEMGGRDYYAPVQTLGDYISGVAKNEPNRVMPTYRNGKVRIADLNTLFPDEINSMLKLGFNCFDRQISGFCASDSVITGVESRTSSPLRINRNAEGFTTFADNVYPAGEGAGYAGGITSSAVDGIATAQNIMKRFAPHNN